MYNGLDEVGYVYTQGRLQLRNAVSRALGPVQGTVSSWLRGKVGDPEAAVTPQQPSPPAKAG